MSSIPTRPSKAPKATRSTAWRTLNPYIMLVATAFCVSMVIKMADQDRMYAALYWVVGVLIALAMLVWLHRTATIVTQYGVRTLVAHTIAHPVSNLYIADTLHRLQGGQGGWLRTGLLHVHGGETYAYNDTWLVNHPSSNDTSLVVRDDSGNFHLFRFGNGAMDTVNFRPSAKDAVRVIDHGIAGPARFEVGMTDR